MNKRQNKARYWRSVFRRIVCRYDDVRSTYAAWPAMDYESAIDGYGQAATYRGIRPTPADFIADVELAAKRALTPLEWVFFKNIYIDKNEGYKTILLEVWGEDKYTGFKHSVQEQVGRMLVQRKIHPFEHYMTSSKYRR